MIPRRYYLFALRDQLPLGEEGWAVARHTPDCADSLDETRLVCDEHTCRADTCRLVQVRRDDVEFEEALNGLSEVLDQFLGSTPTDRQAPSTEGPAAWRSYAIVGGPHKDGEDHAAHWQRCFALLHEVVKGLRQATQAHIPNLTIERVWPLYFIVREDQEGRRTPWNLVLVEHTLAVGTAPASEEQLEMATHSLLAAWRRSPVEVYRDFELSAQNALRVDGDYVEAVLKAATAAEVLLKQAAWTLEWEAELFPHEGDKVPLRGDAIFRDRPQDLIAAVLAPRLKGNWSSQDARHPVGGWRAAIGRPRNRTIHQGHRLTDEEAYGTLAALDVLEKHVTDRIAANADAYPRAALLVCGRFGLEKRGRWSLVEAIAEHPTNWALEYRTWLDARLEDAGDPFP